jgi:predicted DCC family thiol-disulfide oxidoreductase YuxK
VIVLYDADCGFCRWAMAWAVRRDTGRVLVAVAIQSARGCELLAEIPTSERLRSAHTVAADGRVRSGGAAAADVLSALERTRALGRLARGLPRTTALLYTAVATRRASFGRLVGAAARQRADELLSAASAVQTTADLKTGSRELR